MHDTIDPALRQLIADVISSMTDGGEFMSMLPRGKADLVYHLRERGRQDLAERIEAGAAVPVARGGQAGADRLRPRPTPTRDAHRLRRS